MFTKHVKLLLFLVTLPSTISYPDSVRSQVNTNFRGQSFGLENFLFQTYEDGELKNPIRNIKPQRGRPTVSQRITSSDRGQTYGLENLSAQLYESSRLKPTQPKLSPTYQKRKLVEQFTETSKTKANTETKKEPTTVITQEPDYVQSETVTQEMVTERIRKRIMMRRRRKRPPNTVQGNENGDVTGNAILKAVRIPVFPQISKAVIRTETSQTITAETPQRKSLTTQPELIEEVTEKELTTETEKFAVITNKKPTTTEKPSTINLKTFLKQQTETLSLSELLQTQNLSLADLLRGNKDASAILKPRQNISSTTPTPNESFKRKTFNKEEASKQEYPKQLEVLEMTTLRQDYNKFSPKIPRIKTHHMTQRPEDILSKKVEENFEDVSRHTKRPNLNFESQARLNDLRLKLRNFQKKTYSPFITTAQPEKEEIIQPFSSTTEMPLYKKNRVSFKSTNNPELSLIIQTKIKSEPNSKRPDRITTWTNRLPSIKRFGQETIKGDILTPKPLKIPILKQEIENNSEESAELTTTPKTIISIEEMKKPEPKDELIELLKSGQNAHKLQKILHSRNMTLQELLDNREKPPLQMNISQLFSNYQEEEPVRSSLPTLFDSLPDFELDHKNQFQNQETLDYEEPYAEESAPTIAKVELFPSRESKQFDLTISEKNENVDLNLQPDDSKTDTSNAENSALWNLSEKSIYYGNSFNYGDATTTTEKSKGIAIKNTKLSESDIVLLETIRQNQETNRKFKLNFGDFVHEEEGPHTEDIEKSYIPPAVKSAIIASGVVMGIALFVFIAIFATCGWKQRQVRLKGSSSIIGDTLTKTKSKRTNTLSPVSFKDTSSYKKTIDFDDETSESGTSNTSSYLWSTLKNTFTSRTSTLKSRLEKEENMREDKVILKRNENKKKVESRLDDRSKTFETQEERLAVKKIDRDRNVINTSFNFKRSPGNNNINHFNDCIHGY